MRGKKKKKRKAFLSDPDQSTNSKVNMYQVIKSSPAMTDPVLEKYTSSTSTENIDMPL